MKKFAVIGQPIKHSLSPKIHYEFAKETGIDISYEAIEINPKDFKKKTVQLFENGYTGLNVTLPLKELAYNLADEVSQKGREWILCLFGLPHLLNYRLVLLAEELH